MAGAPVNVFLDTSDMQGLVLRGYGSLWAARFFVLEVRDAPGARAYLRELSERVDRPNERTGTCAIQVAFTKHGLATLGVSDDTIKSFSREFIEGMHDEVRAKSLGDDPSQWQWGTGPNVHVLLMFYGHREPHLDELLKVERPKVERVFNTVREQHTTKLYDHKEHFGWRDGLSQPNIDGVPKPKDREWGKKQSSWTDPVKPGEFVLGYPNEYDCPTESPTAAAKDDPDNHLPVMADGRKDLGLNGTYLVYREIDQRVFDFWKYLVDHSAERGANEAERAIALGAKMVGRWPSGAPLIIDPERDNELHATENTFMYSGDRAGIGCPVGAHIRRANPRDVLGSDRPTDDSEIMVRKHQMIRRGRPFGPALSPLMNPYEILAAPRDDVRRGLHFICLVGAISRQFEFVQRAWIHSANFGGQFKDGDPIAAARRPKGDPNPNNEFTCPAVPVRRKYKEMPPFTTLVGGAYFFLPGIRALRFIASER
jgi:Dyp-type peroxidase family